jgi:Protein of unknown function (DUF3307)
MTFFDKLILGHLIGDFVLQNKWMAYRKVTNYFPCLVHCLIYTLSVCLLTSFNPAWATIVFLSHFPIDKWSLADKWLSLINGRSLKDYFDNGSLNIPVQNDPQYTNYLILRGSFTGIVYTVVDNTLHLMLMLLGAYFLGLI